MTVAVLLDTSFLITLVNRARPNHEIAAKYYRLMLAASIPMYFSAIAAAEFGIRQPITDLPLKNFRFVPFNISHGVKAAQLWNALGATRDDTPRAAVRDDIKLIAQAWHDSIPLVLTEDQKTLHNYCERLRAECICDVRTIVLANGYDPGAFSLDGQQGLDLNESE